MLLSTRYLWHYRGRRRHFIDDIMVSEIFILKFLIYLDCDRVLQDWNLLVKLLCQILNLTNFWRIDFDKGRSTLRIGGRGEAIWFIQRFIRLTIYNLGLNKKVELVLRQLSVFLKVYRLSHGFSIWLLRLIWEIPLFEVCIALINMTVINKKISIFALWDPRNEAFNFIILETGHKIFHIFGIYFVDLILSLGLAINLNTLTYLILLPLRIIYTAIRILSFFLR